LRRGAGCPNHRGAGKEFAGRSAHALCVGFQPSQSPSHFDTVVRQDGQRLLLRAAAHIGQNLRRRLQQCDLRFRNVLEGRAKSESEFDTGRTCTNHEQVRLSPARVDFRQSLGDAWQSFAQGAYRDDVGKDLRIRAVTHA